MVAGSACPKGRSRVWFSPAPKPSRETLKFWTLSNWATRSSWLIDDKGSTTAADETHRGRESDGAATGTECVSERTRAMPALRRELRDRADDLRRGDDE